MKSLEEVIKYKLNFLPKGIDPFYAIQTYTPERIGYIIYKTKNTIFSNDSFSLMEDITPLFIYISSCDKYYRENGYGRFVDIVIISKTVDGNSLLLGSSCHLDYNDLGEHYEHKIAIVKNNANEIYSRKGYCGRYTKPFTLIIHGSFHFFLTDEDRLALERQAEEER